MDLQNKIVGLVGKKGTGKSTLLRGIVERCSRPFVYDTMGEHSEVPNRFGSLDDVDQFLAWAETQSYAAGAYTPVWQSENDLEEVCDWIYQQGSFSLVIEEMPMYCSPGALPPSLDRLVRLGRHRRVNLVWTAQRMAEVARRLTAATDFFVLFANREPRDLDAIAERCGSDVAEQVARLPLHGYLVWDVIAARIIPVGALYAEFSQGRGSQSEGAA